MICSHSWLGFKTNTHCYYSMKYCGNWKDSSPKPTYASYFTLPSFYSSAFSQKLFFSWNFFKAEIDEFLKKFEFGSKIALLGMTTKYTYDAL